MGAGRKTETYTLAPDSLNSYGTSWCVRNLEKKDLCGVIFGCKFSTIKECYAKKLFGLPAALMLFLFNDSDRTPRGIFEAASEEGQLNINPKAWSPSGTDPSPYPAQVKMRVRVRCEPLVEEKFSPVIADNYKDAKMFWFELDRDQTSKLLRMFSPSPYVRAPSTYKYGIADLDQDMEVDFVSNFHRCDEIEFAHKEFGTSVTEPSTSTNDVPSQASKGVENPWSSASRAVSSRQDSRELSNAARGTSCAAINMIGPSKEVSSEDTHSEIDWDAASKFQAHPEGLNMILEDPSDGFNSCGTMRNLQKGDLCGVIFGCKFCTKKLFGLPAADMAYIKNIDPALTLFLFNDRDLTMKFSITVVEQEQRQGMINVLDILSCQQPANLVTEQASVSRSNKASKVL